MVYREIYVSGLPATTANLAIQPNMGYRWILYALILLITESATAGTRSILATRNSTVAEWLTANHTDSLGVAGDIVYASGGVAGAGGGHIYGTTEGNSLNWSAPLVVGTFSGLAFRYVMQTGDTGGYIIVMEEVLDE